jgi:pimeloyl-ACP methyl ester carboxylesterase
MEPFTVALADGRTLAGALFGPPDGAPLFYFHGMPGSRGEPALFAEPAATTLGLRIVALERPGYGASDPSPGRTILAWAQDVAAAADHLGIPRFAVLGYSGGGAYALACAYALPERVTKATVIEGLGAFDRGGALDALPWFHPQRLMLGVGAVVGPVLTATAWCIAATGRRWPGALVRMMSRSDRALAARRPDVVAWMAAGMFGAALRQGLGAVVHELRLAIRPWGFPLEDVKVPVRFVHGKDDANCTPDMAEALHARMPGSTLQLLDDAGHLVIFERAHELLRDAA